MGIYVTIEGKENGPYVEEEARHFLNSGDFVAEDLARREGETELRPLGVLLAAPPKAPAPGAPSPVAAGPSIYIMIEGKENGPYDDAEVRHYIKSGDFLLKDLARREGQTKLQPLAAVLAAASQPAKPNAPLKARRLPNGRAEPTPWVEDKQTGPSGVGGWLLFFCVVLTILSPLRFVVQSFQTYIGGKKVLDAFPGLQSSIHWESTGSLILVAFGVYVGVAIWSGHPNGRSLARRYLLTCLFGFFLIEIIAIGLLGSVPSNIRSFMFASVGRAVVIQSMSFAIWWSYFQRSVRVRNTYGPE